MGKRDVEKIKNVIISCNGSDCRKKGAKELGRCARRIARELGSKSDTMFIQTKCTGMCKQAPVMSVQPANLWLLEADEKKLKKAMEAHLAG